MSVDLPNIYFINLYLLEQWLTDLGFACYQYNCLDKCNTALHVHGSAAYSGDRITVVDPKSKNVESTRPLQRSDITLASFNGLFAL